MWWTGRWLVASVRFKHSSRGYQNVMKSAGMRADLQRRADQVKQVAGPQFDVADDDLWGTPVEVIADTYVGKSRAGGTVVAVHPAALKIESERRILGGAIDAAG